VLPRRSRFHARSALNMAWSPYPERLNWKFQPVDASRKRRKQTSVCGPREPRLFREQNPIWARHDPESRYRLLPKRVVTHLRWRWKQERKLGEAELPPRISLLARQIFEQRWTCAWIPELLRSLYSAPNVHAMKTRRTRAEFANSIFATLRFSPPKLILPLSGFADKKKSLAR